MDVVQLGAVPSNKPTFNSLNFNVGNPKETKSAITKNHQSLSPMCVFERRRKTQSSPAIRLLKWEFGLHKEVEMLHM